ncbi:MAG: sigma-70 family RNA polymerase sigma factor [Aureliella sp.]
MNDPKSAPLASNLPTLAPSAGGARLPDGERTRWLLKHEHRLRVLARLEIHQRLAGKFDPSDVVQQTLMEAWQGWDRLETRDEPQRIAWLRQILAHQLARLVRYHEGTQKRDVTRELSIEQSLDQSARRLGTLLAASDPSPSQIVAAQEQIEQLARVLEELPEDYRQVILLRNLEELSHAEVAERMGRSEAAVRMLWLRALAALSAALPGVP